MLRVLLLALALAWPASPEPTDPGIAGTWLGHLEVGSARLRLILRIGDGDPLSARLDSPDQGAFGIALSGFSRNGRGLRFELRAQQASFRGQLSSDGAEINGEWQQAGVRLPIQFRRAGSSVFRPQEPRKPYPYREEEVMVENRLDRSRFPGALAIPPARTPAPAVLVLGSTPDRNCTVANHRSCLVLSDLLARQGVVALRVERRGGAPEQGISDLVAAVEFLQSRKEVNPRQIGLVAHGDAAQPATLAAARCTGIAFLVLLAPVSPLPPPCPVLAVYGERDSRVIARDSVPLFTTALEGAGAKNYSLVKLPGLNHLLQSCQSCLPEEYGRIEETMAPQAIEIIGRWIARQTR